MRIRDLFEGRIYEDAATTVGIAFGRFNPPHKGHRQVWERASENKHWFIGTNPSTQGLKDPLPLDVKMQAMEAVWPPLRGHILAEQSFLTLASRVYETYGDVTLNVYTDEAWVVPLIQEYNGKSGDHGFYEFSQINWKNMERLASATDLRAAVVNDDPAAFERAAGVPADTPVAGTGFFDLVKHYLMPYHQAEIEKQEAKARRAAEKAAKDEAKAAKAAKKAQG